MTLRTFEIRLRFQARDRDDADLAIDGLDDHIGSWDPPFWLEGEPIEVRPGADEPEVLERYAVDDPTAFGMAGRWNKLRVPFIGKESAALIIERNSRNGLDITAEIGEICAEVTGDRPDRGGHFVAGPRLGIVQGDRQLLANTACCGQHAAFRHLMTIPRPLAAAFDLEQPEGKFGSVQFYFDIVDELDGHIRVFNRHAYEARLAREGRRAGRPATEEMAANASFQAAVRRAAKPEESA